ncbi:MobF family relaxase [Luteimonas sp. MC1750]|uniref:MobF family relaxase n=1 Tax=Luteimonas sp. MC1750 TaxID=2799326 RepID=UPI0018F0AC2C|nr:MobF family relaxase [Luteimonas sp. MC1750]MBJ6984041.1 relaxase domain-containing protein [Luteimonas sp. MC1750]QQO06853.1 relaxase domain-containing protein [Luteimonas sp. MC1750]
MAEDTMRWGGAGAEMLALRGKKVEREAMLELAAGYSPDGLKTALCQNAGVKPQKKVKLDAQGNPRLDSNGDPITKWEGGHQVGYDCTYTAPKSVSFLMAIATPEERGKIIAAHRAAANTSMEHLAGLIETRRGKGGKDVIGIDGAVWVACDHATERENGFHLHTHNILFGVARGEDGKWGTYESKEIYRHQKVADAIYMSHLAEGLRELGYGIEQDAKLDSQGQDTGERAWRVAGVSRDTELLFSERQAQIHEAMKSGISKQQAWNQTRKSKDEPEMTDLFEEWKQVVASHGLDTNIENYKGLASVLAPARSDEEILRALHETTAVVSEPDIIWAVYQARAGQAPQQQEADVERLKANMYKVAPERQAAIDQGTSVARRHSEYRYAAEFIVKSEVDVLTRAEQRKDDESVRVPKSTLDEVVAQFQKEKGFTLSSEQSAAIEHLCVDSGGHAVMAGVAGAGKTTVAELYKRVFEANGQHVIGACQAKSAARKLTDESGIEALTIKSMLHRLDQGKPLTKDHPTLNSKSVVVIDEAGMVDTERVRRLMEHVDKSQGKLLLMGDLKQLQAISAGSGMALVMDKIGHAELTEIRRQKDAADRDTAESYYDKDADGRIILGPRVEPKSRSEVAQKSAFIFNKLEANDCIDAFDTRDQAMNACVSDWMKSPHSIDNRLLLAHDHADIAALTGKVRDALRGQGTLKGEDHTFQAAQGQGKNERVYNMSVAVGDRVRITKNDNSLGVVNGDIAEVEGIARTETGSLALNLRVEGQKGAPSFVVAVDTQEWNHLSHGYCRTVHGAQGQGNPAIFHFANAKMMDNQSAMVAFTRLTSPRGYRMYGSELEIDQIRNRLGVDRFKQNATQEGLIGDQPHRIKPVREPEYRRRASPGLEI